MNRRHARSIIAVMTFVLVLAGTTLAAVNAAKDTPGSAKGAAHAAGPATPADAAADPCREATTPEPAGAPPEDDWRPVPGDDCGPSFGIAGTAASEPKGITLSGRACSLEQPFEVKTKGDILGTITFRPSSETAGAWSYKGKPFNAPFKVVGSGSYSVDVADDGLNGNLDLDFVLTIKIPSVGSQTRGSPLSLTLTPAMPCRGQGS